MPSGAAGRRIVSGAAPIASASSVWRVRQGWSPGRNTHPCRSGCCASSAIRPRRTVSLRRGSAWRSTGKPSARQRASTSAERVTAMRPANTGAAASASAWTASGRPFSSAISLLPPNRRPSPEAMTMQPSGGTGQSRSYTKASGSAQSARRNGVSCLRTTMRTRQTFNISSTLC